MDKRIDLLLELNKEMREKLETLSIDVAVIKARKDERRSIFKSIGFWVNSLVITVLAAYVQWKFNRLG